MPRDVFISHASEDHALAVQVCELLEQRGLTCWIAPRDVGAGLEWDEAILDAIELSHSFLLLLSANANRSSFVKNELNRAFSGGKPIVTFRMEEVMPGRSLELYLARHHWTDAFPPPLEPRVEQLATSLTSLLGRSVDGSVHVPAPAHAIHAPVKPKSIRSPIYGRGWRIVAVAAALGMAAMAWPVVKHLQEVPPPETRVDITTPATSQPNDFALSPDGRQIVFVANDNAVPRLWLRSLASATAQPLPGTEGATAPFWSPDSHSIGFFAASALKRLDLRGGQPQLLTPTTNNRNGAGAWDSNGVILFPGDSGSLSSVAATGGKVTAVIEPSALYSFAAFPQILPGGHQVLLSFLSGSAPGIYLSTLDGRPPVRLTPDTNLVGYLPSGRMLWRRGDALVAQRLDLKKAALTGDLQTLANDITSASVSAAGLVAYRMGKQHGQRLTWFDRSGTALGTIGEGADSYASARVAPDGRRVAMGLQVQGNGDIWILDGKRTSHLTFDPSLDVFPLWSPDGSRIVFSKLATDHLDLYEKPSSGAGAEELLLASDQVKIPFSWSADGKFLLYLSGDSKTGVDLWVLPMTGDRIPFVFLKTPFDEVWGQFSPDGRWVAYHSNESGRFEVYVRPFVRPDDTGVNPKRAEGKWQVSIEGGVYPSWRPDGKELYFVNPGGGMMAAPITTTATTVESGTAVRLFQTHMPGGGDDNNRQGRQYDVAPDGRFLINTVDADVATQITLIQNWNPDAGK